MSKNDQKKETPRVLIKSAKAQSPGDRKLPKAPEPKKGNKK